LGPFVDRVGVRAGGRDDQAALLSYLKAERIEDAHPQL